MLQFIKNLFKSKPAENPYHTPYNTPYPEYELKNIREYKNKQHQKAMKAKIDKDPSDAIRKAGW